MSKQTKKLLVDERENWTDQELVALLYRSKLIRDEIWRRKIGPL